MSCATTKGTWNAIWSNKFTVSTFVRPSNWRTHKAHSEAVSCDCIHAASCGVIGLRRKTRKTSKTTSQLQLTRKRPQAGFQETHQIVRRSKKLFNIISIPLPQTPTHQVYFTGIHATDKVIADTMTYHDCTRTDGRI